MTDIEMRKRMPSLLIDKGVKAYEKAHKGPGLGDDTQARHRSGIHSAMWEAHVAATQKNDHAELVPLPTFDNPHGWTWRNDMRNPSSLHVQPAFKAELGKVFVRIDQNGDHLGIWLTGEVMEQFIASMRAAADALAAE